MLTKEQVEYIAELAKLALSDDEKERFRGQLSAILDYAESLQRLDTSAISPTASVLPITTVLRDDASRGGWPEEAILANTAAKEAGMFRVDVVLEEE